MGRSRLQSDKVECPRCPRPHLEGRDDALAEVAPLLALVRDWRRLLTSAVSEEEFKRLDEEKGTSLIVFVFSRK